MWHIELKILKSVVNIMKYITFLKLSLSISLGLILTGCNSHIPEKIKVKPANNIDYKQVDNDREQFSESYVRWGGKIVAVENKENLTHIEILANPLNSFGRPIQNDDYQGRFIAAIDGFIDPEYYAKDRSVTVYGKIKKYIVKNIDEHPYQYPLIEVEQHYLWKNNRVVLRNGPYFNRFWHPYFYSFPRYYPRYYFRH